MVNIPEAERFGRMQAEREEVDRRVSDLERTDGSQYARALEKIKSLISGLDAQVAAAIAANSYTRAQIDGIVAGINAAAIASTRIAGVLAPSQGGTGTGNVHDTTAGGTQRAVYVTPAGGLTVGASTARLKQDVATPAVDLARVLALTPRQFRWRCEIDTALDAQALDVLADDGGPTSPAPDPAPVAPLDYGLIAEEADAAGLGWLVRYDSTGRPEGVLYERLPIALLHVAREHDDRVASLETQIQGITALAAQQQAQIDMLTARLDGQEGVTP